MGLGNYKNNPIDAFDDAHEYPMRMYASNAEGAEASSSFQEGFRTNDPNCCFRKAVINKVYEINMPKWVQGIGKIYKCAIAV